ncbi:hypothetical protein [Jeotgalibacillus proteolyticus]|nr:hypothetical protein [Jeotgalibacillus proteolyticus]
MAKIIPSEPSPLLWKNEADRLKETLTFPKIFLFNNFSYDYHLSY